MALAELSKTDKKSAARIEVLAPLVRTTVQSIDAARRKLTFAEKTVDVAAHAHIAVNRRALPFADIAPGTRVLLTLNLERTQVLAIQVYPRADARCDDDDRCDDDRCDGER